jgi:hypothetical protein
MLLFFRLDGRTNAQLRPEAMDFGAGVFRVTALCGADGDPLGWCDRSVRNSCSFPGKKAPFV